MVSLTPEGKRVLERIKRRNERHVAEVLEPLAAAERTKVHAGLTILGRMLSPTDAVKKTR
jgi:DNA-binding MarR family transcriptional regulator